MIPRRFISSYKEFDRDLVNWILKKKSEKKEYRAKFSEKLCEYLGTKKIYPLSSGRSTIPLILESIGIKKDDEIIVAAYNLKALIPIFEQYCNVKYADIDKKTYSINPSSIKNKLTKKTKALVLTHTFGFCTNIEDIKKITTENEITLIEDCAHSLGSQYKNKHLGTFGDFVLFSFDYIKPLSTLKGGALGLNGEKYVDVIEKTYSNMPEPSSKKTSKNILYYYFQKILINTKIFTIIKPVLDLERPHNIISRFHQGTNKVFLSKEKLSNFQCMVGIKSLKYLDAKLHKLSLLDIEFRRQLKTDFHKNLHQGENSRLSYYFYTYNTQGRAKQFRKLLAKAGIDVGTESEVMDLCDETCSNAKEIYESLIQLPFYTKLKPKDIKYIAEQINKIEESLDL